MALLVPLLQRYTDLRDGTLLIVTKVKLLSASDTVTVPLPHNTITSASVGRCLPAATLNACTATQSSQTVTLSGTAGDIVYVTTLHQSGNSRPEA